MLLGTQCDLVPIAVFLLCHNYKLQSHQTIICSHFSASHCQKCARDQRMRIAAQIQRSVKKKMAKKRSKSTRQAATNDGVEVSI